MTYVSKSFSTIKEQSRLQFVTRREADVNLQALLIDAAYHIHCGNSDPLNAILADAKANNAVRIRAITLWCELNLPVRVKNERFKINKDWVKVQVKSDAEFTPYYEALKAAPTFWEVTPKEKAESVWDMFKKFDALAKDLEKHGAKEAAIEVRALSGKLAQATIV